MPVSKKQRDAALSFWDSYVPLSDEVIAQYHAITTSGDPIDYYKVPSYDWHVLDDLLANHRSWPWIMKQEKKDPITFLPDVLRMNPGPCRDKWLKFKGWESYAR